MPVASSDMLIAVAIEINPPRRKEIIAPDPAFAEAIPGRMNIPAPIIVPVPIAKVEKKQRLRPNLSVVPTAAISISICYRSFKQ
jgi:hypothetical protein